MRKIHAIIMALGLILSGSVPLSGQHFVPVYESLYQPMNILATEVTISGTDLEADDEIGIFDTDGSGNEICVGSIILSGPVLPGAPLPIVASTDDPLTPEQDGFLDGNTIIYRFWDDSEGIELICVTASYDAGFDEVFTSLGTALCSLEGIYSPTCNAGSDDESCSDTPYTLSGTAANQESVLWETSGDGTFDDATLLTASYSPGPGDVSSGFATLTLTAFAVSPCGDHAIDDMILSIQAAPEANAGGDDAVCENSSYTLAGSASNETSVEWSTAGDGSFNDPTLLNATYTPGPGDISSGSVVLTLSAFPILPCANPGTDNMTLSIQQLPTASAGADANTCANQAYTLSGSATNYSSVLWTTDGDGSFDDASILNATYTPGPGDISSGVTILTLTANAVSPCGGDADDSMVLTIQALPLANAGPDDDVCEGGDYVLFGTASNQSSVEWSTDGDGSFDDPTMLDATYTPGPGDISNGSVILSLTAYAISPCNTSMIDQMTLSIKYLPDQPDTPVGPTEVDVHITPVSEYTGQLTPGAITYDWTFWPEDAGNFSAAGLEATVFWNAAYYGYAYIKIIAVNACGGVASDSLEVFVYNTVGTGELQDNDIQMKIIPNPNNGRFRLEAGNIQGRLNMAIFGCDGNLVMEEELEKGSFIQLDLDLSHLPGGLYFIRLFNENCSHLSKVIIQ